MARRLLCLVACLIAFRVGATEKGGNLHDGFTCAMRMTQDGKAEDKDTLEFAAFTGASRNIAKAYQFAPGPCTMTRMGQD